MHPMHPCTRRPSLHRLTILIQAFPCGKLFWLATTCGSFTNDSSQHGLCEESSYIAGRRTGGRNGVTIGRAEGAPALRRFGRPAGTDKSGTLPPGWSLARMIFEFEETPPQNARMKVVGVGGGGGNAVNRMNRKRTGLNDSHSGNTYAAH